MTSYTFLPGAFIIQFFKVVNVFYFFNGLLQFIPSIQTVNPLSTFLPLIMVVATGMIKEGIIDYKRYKSDKDTNAKRCEVWDKQSNATHSRGFKEVKWENLKVGDVVRLRDKQ